MLSTYRHVPQPEPPPSPLPALLGFTDDIGAAAVYLASAEASYITGQTLHVNGGMAMI